jgi:fermentation-respiration switch protein FrsA (DUF1100 family)
LPDSTPTSPTIRRRTELTRRRVVVTIALLVTIAAVLVLLPAIRTATLTAALVPELLDLPIRPLRAMVPEPTLFSTTYGDPPDPMDIYMPADATDASRLPAVVLALGVHPQPIDHPDVTHVAAAISRLGVVVGVPDSTDLRNLVVTPREPGHLADAVIALAGLPYVDRGRVGLAGFSAGASIALIAATDERIAHEIRFVSSFGAYADAQLLLTDVATRTAVVDGEIRAWQPDARIRRDVLELTLATLSDERVREELRVRLDPIVSSDTPPSGPLPEDLAAFEGDARAVYVLFTAPDRQAASAALSGISSQLREHLDGISPLAFADRIRSPVFLLHGEPDTAVSVGHSALLSERLGNRLARFTRFGEFGHGQPGLENLGPAEISDVWELYVYLRDIVAAATE